MAPWVNTLCSYRATSAPSARGVSRSARMVLVGRLPSKVRCGTSASGVPSALTSSGVLQQAQDDGQVAFQRCGAEVLVHAVEAGQQIAEGVGADRQHGGQADS